jgi:hypothetical protein
MSRLLTLFAVAALVAVAVSPANAGNGVLRLSWDDCDPLVLNKNWSGPNLYKLVLSVTAADVENQGHRSQVLVGPNVPEAWRFDAAGCNTGQLTVSHNALSKECLAFQGNQPLGLSQYSYDGVTGRATLDIANAYDPFLPLAPDRYTVWQATFDHAFSAPGDEDPVLFCRFAAQPLCFVLLTPITEVLLVDGTKQAFDGADSEWVSWEDPGNELGCPLPTQNNTTTWGKVKGLYR